MLQPVKYFAAFMLLLAYNNSKAESDNIAPKATITASSSLNERYKPSNVADGLIGVDGKGEWACKGETTDWGFVKYPWIQLEWKQPELINRVVLYDRPSEKEHIASGKLLFSDGTSIAINTIPDNGTAKVISFNPKLTKWIRFVTTDGDGNDLGFSEIEVFNTPARYKDYTSWVDPYIETNRGRYFYFITGSRPFGMMTAAPLTRNKNQFGGGYNYNEKYILGFSQIHDWMISGLEIMPAPSNINPTGGEAAWRSEFSHDDEIVQPGYQRVFLRDHKTWVEFTATDRVSFYKFTFTENMKAQIITNLGGYVGNSTMANAEVKKVNDHELEGSFSSVKRYWGGPKDVKIYFTIQFDKPFDKLNGWKGEDHLDNIFSLSGDGIGVTPQYKVEAGEELKMKISFSYTSIANAHNNLKMECPGWDFAAVKNETRKVWNDWLGKMDVKGGTVEQKIKFYTDLWHVLLGRHKINDVSGDYPDRTTGKRDGNFTDAIFKVKTLPKNPDGKVKYNMYNSDAWWLTQWNLNILWGLAWPKVQDEMSSSMIQYADNGGLIPRGPSGGGYSYIMTSCPATNLIVSTYMKGLLKGVDPVHAFEAVKRNNLPGGVLGSSDDINFYTDHGYWPDNAGITVEAGFQDYAISQMADKLNFTADRDFFLKRSGGWKNLFEPNQKMLFPKNRAGKFSNTDPLSGAGWVEANSWQATWGISYDIDGLAKLMGGKDALCKKLNYAFEKAQPSDFVYDYSKGYISYANQPGLSDAHVFNYAGKPWLTQYWVRRVRQQAYGGTTPDLGYGGSDEDQGQMGGLDVLMSIGLFNLQGNVAKDPVYDITSPIFDEVTIKLDPEYYADKQFVIKTYNNSAKNCYIQKAMLNGKPLNKFWFRHADYANGGKLELWMGPKPNKQWGLG